MNSGIIWILLASFFGFAVSAIFAGWLKLKRNVYLLFYIPVTALLIYFFITRSGFNVTELISHNCYWGILGAIVAAVFVIKNVLSQPASERNTGIGLLTDIIWPGFTYGLADALLLSVLPVLAIKSAFESMEFFNAGLGVFILGIIALLASFLVTTIYHLGYPEFRGKNVLWPLIGNGVLTIAYLLTMNPLAAILPHIAMHITAMIHGRETTGQVPPHYKQSLPDHP